MGLWFNFLEKKMIALKVRENKWVTSLVSRMVDWGSDVTQLSTHFIFFNYIEDYITEHPSFYTRS